MNQVKLSSTWLDKHQASEIKSTSMDKPLRFSVTTVVWHLHAWPIDTSCRTSARNKDSRIQRSITISNHFSHKHCHNLRYLKIYRIHPYTVYPIFGLTEVNIDWAKFLQIFPHQAPTPNQPEKTVVHTWKSWLLLVDVGWAESRNWPLCPLSQRLSKSAAMEW